MQLVLFYQSLVSDWNHVTAHFLRGLANELLTAGHSVRIFEPCEGWSLHNLREQGGDGLVKAFQATYPRLRSNFYDPITLDLDEALSDADVVIAHEWNDPGFLNRLGRHRAASSHYRLLFHDGPHRFAHQAQASPHRAEASTSRILAHFDGVLTSSDGLRRLYEERGWADHLWTWREAVDTRLFRAAQTGSSRPFDLIWFGSWGDAERATQLNEFLIDPVRVLGLRARFYGERYPESALRMLAAAGIDYGGWVPDFCLPGAMAAGRFTVHVPWRARTNGVACTPVIRVLQALACGIAVVSAPWDECTELFTPGVDLLVGRDGSQVARHLAALHGDRDLAQSLAARGHQTVLMHHTCAHRARELLAICAELGARTDSETDLATLAPVLAGSPLPQRAPLPQGAHGGMRAQQSSAPAAWS